MSQSSTGTDRQRRRDLRFFRDPKLWPYWPLLPLVRRRPGQEEEYGLLYDALGVGGHTGLSATVFLANFFQLPPTEAEFLDLPHETYDTPEEVADAGWSVD